MPTWQSIFTKSYFTFVHLIRQRKLTDEVRKHKLTIKPPCGGRWHEACRVTVGEGVHKRVKDFKVTLTTTYRILPQSSIVDSSLLEGAYIGNELCHRPTNYNLLETHRRGLCTLPIYEAISA